MSIAQRLLRRIVAPFVLASLLILTVVPAVFAASDSTTSTPPSGIRIKAHYLALGDSLAFGYQPNGDYTHGYVPDLFADLQKDGAQTLLNLGCPEESSVTMINGNCPASPGNNQLATALAYLHANVGQVSPVTLDIGANDVLKDFDISTCTVLPAFSTDLATLDSNLKTIILPNLHAALMVNNHLSGDIVMMNYYTPFQNICPNAVSFTQLLNKHLANDVKGFGHIVNVFYAFGGPTTPNPNICTYTWICDPTHHDIHATTLGYQVIANTFDGFIDTE